MPDRSPQAAASSGQQAHPLVKRLIAAVGAGAPVLEIGAGSGRNTAALRAAGCEVSALADGACRAPLPYAGAQFSAALSTHGLFHGRPPEVRALCAEIARVLCAQAPFYFTLTAREDARYGLGERVDEDTFAPLEGPEAGVPHAYFSREAVRALIADRFTLESLELVAVDAIVGRWAHGADEPPGKVHWFVLARRR